MSQRAQQQHAVADNQIRELIELVSALDDPTMRLPCPGREKLGDGTIAAAAQHTADNYQRIAEVVQASDRMTGPGPSAHGGHAMPRFLKALGHRPPDHSAPGPDSPGFHPDGYTAENVDLPALREQLAATRESLKRIATLTDSQLATVPPDGSFRFADGQRTLEQVLEGVLKHQSHQVAALTTALA